MDDLLSSTLEDVPIDIVLASIGCDDDNSDLSKDKVEQRPVGTGSSGSQTLTVPDYSEGSLRPARKRFKFNNRLDLALIQKVQLHSAQTVEHGKTQKIFEDVLRSLLAHTPKVYPKVNLFQIGCFFLID